MAEKRVRSSPTGKTPVRPLKKAVPRRRLLVAAEKDPDPTNESAGTRSHVVWTEEENKALLEFILLHKPEDKWPATKCTRFWGSAADYVMMRGKGTAKRTGMFMFSYRYSSVIYSASAVQ